MGKKAIKNQLPMRAVASKVGEIIATIASLRGVLKVAPVGAYRRGNSSVSSVTVLAACSPKAHKRVVDRFCRMGVVTARGRDKACIFIGDLRVKLEIVPRGSWGVRLHRRTGPDNHVRTLRTIAKSQGLVLDRNGLWDDDARIAGRSEKGVYEALGEECPEPAKRQ
jgi:DNA polymerase (family X)